MSRWPEIKLRFVIDMKQIRFSNLIAVFALRLAIGALLLAGLSLSSEVRANDASIFATSAADGGRLYIQRSPTLGDNVSLAITIDGVLAGPLSRGRTFDRFIKAGRHVVVVSPNGSRVPGQTTLDVHRGHTYAYSVSSSGNKLVLTPVSPAH